MIAQWTGDIIGKMHIYSIIAKELADYLGYNPKYVSAIFNGKRCPKKAEKIFTEAVDAIAKKRQTVQQPPEKDNCNQSI